MASARSELCIGSSSRVRRGGRARQLGLPLATATCHCFSISPLCTVSINSRSISEEVYPVMYCVYHYTGPTESMFLVMLYFIYFSLKKEQKDMK